MRFDAQTLKRLYERQLEAAATPGGGDTHHGTRTFRAMLKASRQTPARQLDGERMWIWSDLHLGHDNIIGYANRPFRDAEEMDEELYANWYATVGVDDTLIFAGDVAMRDAVAAHTWQRIRTAPGKSKRLVFGNHDLTGAGTLRVDGFDDICSAACIDGDPPLLITHMPLAEVPAGASTFTATPTTKRRAARRTSTCRWSNSPTSRWRLRMSACWPSNWRPSGIPPATPRWSASTLHAWKRR